MSRAEMSAATKPAPVATADANTDVLVAAVTTSASAETDVYRAAGGLEEWYELTWDPDVAGDKCYVTIGALAGVTDPSVTATTGAGRAVLLPAGLPVPYEFDSSRRALKTIGLAGTAGGTGAGYLRIARVGLRK